MKAVRLMEIGQPLQMQKIPVPAVGRRDILVQVKAAGICHSDVHYRAGISPAGPLPLTLGHEVAGIVAEAGEEVTSVRPGDRVCLHYLITCGECEYCARGSEQFCRHASMIGKYRDGGFAEYIVVPARNAFILPPEIPFEIGAVMMCSSATSFHALRKAGLQAGERAAIFGVGGLGMSAIQLARAFGAIEVFAVDIDPAKLKLAERFGAVPVDNRRGDAVEQIRERTGGAGVDVAVELIGLPATIRQAVDAVGIFGRVVLVGLSDRTLSIHPYRDLVLREVQLIGSSDHLAQEIPTLLELARRRVLDLSAVVTRTIPLDAEAINAAMDELEHFGGGVLRTVVMP
ncbi:MAG: alcohol dehydrogenase catalytic domain-containing protein [Anaerolineae bacterium]